MSKIGYASSCFTPVSLLLRSCISIRDFRESERHAIIEPQLTVTRSCAKPQVHSPILGADHKALARNTLEYLEESLFSDTEASEQAQSRAVAWLF